MSAEKWRSLAITPRAFFLAISLAVALGYYLFVMLMLSLQKSYAIHPETLIFLPVGICLALSGWFVKRNL